MSLLVIAYFVGVTLQPAAPSGAIAGRVLAETTGAPVAGALVMLSSNRPESSQDDRRITTDSNGSYEFRDLKPGRYWVTATHPAFLLPDGPAVPVDVLIDERRRAVNLHLQSGAVIAGRVLDEAGEPLIGSQVIPMRRRDDSFNDQLTAESLVPHAGGNKTNDLGEFRCFGLPPGEYHMLALPAPHLGGHIRAGVALTPTFYPDASEVAESRPIFLAAGQTHADVIIRVRAEAVFSVSGTVVDHAGRPVANALVALTRPESSQTHPVVRAFAHQSRSADTGAFVIPAVRNGSYWLVVAAPFTSHSRSSHPNRHSHGPTDNILFTETKGGLTIEYRDDRATRLSITVNQASVTGVDVTVSRDF